LMKASKCRLGSGCFHAVWCNRLVEAVVYGAIIDIEINTSY
jgi:hypothetical protein